MFTQPAVFSVTSYSKTAIVSNKLTFTNKARTNVVPFYSKVS